MVFLEYLFRLVNALLSECRVTKAHFSQTNLTESLEFKVVCVAKKKGTEREKSQRLVGYLIMKMNSKLKMPTNDKQDQTCKC